MGRPAVFFAGHSSMLPPLTEIFWPVMNDAVRGQESDGAAGDDKVEAATFAFRTYAFAMLAGTLVTIAGFIPVGFAASS